MSRQVCCCQSLVFRMSTVIVNSEVTPKDRYCNYQVNDGDMIDVIYIINGVNYQDLPHKLW